MIYHCSRSAERNPFWPILWSTWFKHMIYLKFSYLPFFSLSSSLFSSLFLLFFFLFVVLSSYCCSSLSSSLSLSSYSSCFYLYLYFSSFSFFFFFFFFFILLCFLFSSLFCFFDFEAEEGSERKENRRRRKKGREGGREKKQTTWSWLKVHHSQSTSGTTSWEPESGFLLAQMTLGRGSARCQQRFSQGPCRQSWARKAEDLVVYSLWDRLWLHIRRTPYP